MKRNLYILSLLSFLSALLVIIILPLDEIFAVKYLLAIILLIISFLFRIFAISPKTGWIDFVTLTTSLILIFIGINLLSPTTEFLITYGEEFNKIYAGILALFPIIQLLTVLKKDYTFSKKINVKIFILTIIVSLITFGGIETYGKTIDLQKLSDSEKSYLYSYGKYTHELINLAIYEIKNGNSMSKKMALNYISKNDRVIEENLNVLEGVIFNENLNSDIKEPIEYQGVELEERLKLMIKISPEKTLVFARDQIADNNINKNLTIITALRTIVRTSPDLSVKSCDVAKEIVKVEMSRSKSKNLSYPDTELMRLKTYIRDLQEKCGNLGLE